VWASIVNETKGVGLVDDPEQLIPTGKNKASIYP
jgi:hypothetical protein